MRLIENNRVDKNIIDNLYKKVSLKEGFEHINDVWSYLEDSIDEEDLKKRIGNIPSKFGSFTYEIINDGDTARVTNDYEEYGDYQSDVVDIDFLGESALYEKLVEGMKKDKMEYQEMLNILLSNLSETGKEYIETYISDGWVSQKSDGRYYMEMIDMNNNSCVNDITYILYFDINNPSDTSKWIIEKYRGNTYCSNYGDYPEMDLALFDRKISSLYRRRG